MFYDPLATSRDLFRDVVEFSIKFLPEFVPANSHDLTEDVQKFRSKFLQEELDEYNQAIDKKDHEKAFDGLIDLIYVALGTAYLHGYDFDAGWERVHAANMAKVRCFREGDSTRGSTWDVIKPAGWTAPVLKDLL